MGWLFREGSRRKEWVAELTQNREHTKDDGVTIRTVSITHCYRGGRFSGVLWTVWERTFEKDGQFCQPTERWIGCDLLEYRNGGWGYKDLDESCGPYTWSCPKGYLDLVPIEKYGGLASWREGVLAYHAEALVRRRKRKAQRSLHGF